MNFLTNFSSVLIFFFFHLLVYTFYNRQFIYITVNPISGSEWHRRSPDLSPSVRQPGKNYLIMQLHIGTV